MANPMPAVEPVMTATLPSKRLHFVVMAWPVSQPESQWPWPTAGSQSLDNSSYHMHHASTPQTAS
jgi:hypothetical protein